MALCVTLKRMAAPRAAGLALRNLSQAVPLDTPFPGSSFPQGTAAPFTAPQVTKLPSGLTVVSEDTGAPVATVTFLVKAGSRFETPEEAGAAGFLRTLAFQGTKNRTALCIARESAAAGVTLSATASREFVAYTATFLRSELKTAIDNLSDAVGGQQFNSWEVKEAKQRVAWEPVCPQKQLLAALHGAAFRSTLGGSECVTPAKAAVLTPDALRAYAAATITAPRIAVAASGIAHDALVAAVDKAAEFTADAGRAATPAKYFGGNSARLDLGGKTTRVAIGFAAPGATAADAAAYGVLRFILASAPAVKWGAGTAAAQAKARGAAKGAVAVDSFAAAYGDAGLFGVTVTSGAADAGKASAAVAGVVKSVLGGAITEADVARAKALLATSILSLPQGCRAYYLGAYALASGAAPSAEARAEAVERVTLADVVAAAKKAAAAKPVLAVAGNLGYAPYLDELF